MRPNRLLHGLVARMVIVSLQRTALRAATLAACSLFGILPSSGFSSAAELDCRQCHDDLGKGAVAHRPFSAGECISCHRLVKEKHHPDDQKSVVLVGGGKVCNQCHDLLDSAKNVHSPVASGDCTACHDPHAAPNGKLLKKTGMPLCLSCHENKFQKKHLHGPVADGNCIICHDPHQSDTPFLLKQGVPGLCFGCHDASIMSGKSVHGPVKKGNCLSCHDAHGSSFRKHLQEDFPEEFYLPFNADKYGICFDCHSNEMVMDRRTDSLTNFRDGDRNLHYLHVNKPDKGRSCKTCHDPHAAEQPKLIKTKIPGFGKWEIPIGFDKTATGGTCIVGCHKPRTYDRQKVNEF